MERNTSNGKAQPSSLLGTTRASHYDFGPITESTINNRTNLCKDCKIIRLEDLELRPKRIRKGKWKLVTSGDPAGVKLDYFRQDIVPSLPGLAASANSGCGFCALLRNAMIRHFRRFPLRRQPHHYIRITQIRHQWCLGLVAFTVHSPCFWSADHQFNYLTFRVSASRNDVCAKLFDITSAVIPDNVISPAGIYTMKRWIFPSKKDTKAQFCPTRLIYVESKKESSHICLVESCDDPTPKQYVALSYLWGPEKPTMKTTKDNLNHLKKSIDFRHIPMAYQDAIRVTRAIGVKYLWIDAICIIQDDADDWERESQAMSEVFTNALVTIIPLCTSSCNDGFLQRNERLKVQYKFKQKLNGSFYLRHIPMAYDDVMHGILTTPTASDRPLSIDLDNSPWPNRGWTFQEKVFSSRKLYFGHIMMHWNSVEPVRTISSEDGVINDDYDMDLEDLWSEGANYDSWYNYLYDYVPRNLTYQSDRLPAISSLAHLFARKSDDTYLAGLWKNDLHRGLLWKRRGQFVKPFSHLVRDLTNKGGVIAPSWSWARQQSQISWDRSDNMQNECQVIEASTVTTGKNKFGHVGGGSLLIRGRLRRFMGLSLKELPRRERSYISQSECLILDNDEYVASCAIDWKTMESDAAQLPKPVTDGMFLLLIASGTTTTPARFAKKPLDKRYHTYRETPDVPVEVMHGLLLFRTGMANEFWRIGIFGSLMEERGGREFFAKAEEHLVRIV